MADIGVSGLTQTAVALDTLKEGVRTRSTTYVARDGQLGNGKAITARLQGGNFNQQAVSNRFQRTVEADSTAALKQLGASASHAGTLGRFAVDEGKAVIGPSGFNVSADRPLTARNVGKLQALAQFAAKVVNSFKLLTTTPSRAEIRDQRVADLQDQISLKQELVNEYEAQERDGSIRDSGSYALESLRQSLKSDTEKLVTLLGAKRVSIPAGEEVIVHTDTRHSSNSYEDQSVAHVKTAEIPRSGDFEYDNEDIEFSDGVADLADFDDDWAVSFGEYREPTVDTVSIKDGRISYGGTIKTTVESWKSVDDPAARAQLTDKIRAAAGGGVLAPDVTDALILDLQGAWAYDDARR